MKNKPKMKANVKIVPRRLLDERQPDGYRESNLDFVVNNLEACVEFLESKQEKFLRERLDKLECTGVASYQFKSLTGKKYFGTTVEFAIKRAMMDEGYLDGPEED